MNKKRLALAMAVLIAVLGLNSCGNTVGQQESSNRMKSGSAVEEFGDSVSADEEEKTENHLMTIKTKYGDLCYPAEFENSLVTEESEENGIYSVTFSTRIGGKKYMLFDVMIGDEEGDSVGTITDNNGAQHNVFVKVNDLENLSDLDQKTQNKLYAMQEGINVLINELQ